MLVLSTLILCSTLMICTSAVLAVFLLSGKPLMSVTVQVAAAPGGPTAVYRGGFSQGGYRERP